MKLFKQAMAVAVLATLASTAMAADEKVVTEEGVATFSFFKPASVRAEVGTLGYGGAVSYNVHPKVGLTLGYNGGDISWSDDINMNGTEYDLEAKNNNVYLNAEIRPFGNAFYTALGVGYIDAEYSVNRTLTGENDVVKIDGKNYSGKDGYFKGEVSYDNTIAPYVGVGFSPSITSRWGMFGEVGAYYTGNPKANFESQGLNAVGTGEAGELAAANEERDFETGSKHEWLPVAKLGVSFRF